MNTDNFVTPYPRRGPQNGRNRHSQTRRPNSPNRGSGRTNGRQNYGSSASGDPGNVSRQRPRGNPREIYGKYITKANEATAVGNHVEAETCFQHAEHYFRVMQPQAQPPQPQPPQQQISQPPQQQPPQAQPTQEPKQPPQPQPLQQQQQKSEQQSQSEQPQASKPVQEKEPVK